MRFAIPQLASLWDFPLFPERASSIAGRIDAMYLALVVLTAVMSTLIFGLLAYFAVKYRANSAHSREGGTAAGSTLTEVVWIGVPSIICLLLFLWSAKLYYDISRTPDNALDIYIVGQQWMWKVQHPGGQKEINDLHVPVGRPVRLTLTSQDVVHDYFMPAFRVKVDVVPNRYTHEWFTPTRPGAYHIFCSQYCGADHARMVGTVYVMEQADYDAWLASNRAGVQAMAASGGPGGTFSLAGCATCHMPAGGAKATAPRLEGIFGTKQKLTDGSEVVVDEEYIRESILDPQKKIVAGPWVLPGPKSPMVSYRASLDPAAINELVAYVKSLKDAKPPE